MSFKFDNTYVKLPERFYQKINPTKVPKPTLIELNEPLAEELGLDIDFLRSEEGINILAGNTIAEGSEPIAQAYAGHQFGNFVPQLGDGRAILLGEIIDTNGKRRDIQLKGSGETAFSRNGDGRATLSSVIREYLVSESMHYLGIPSTRSLAIIGTGENVYREKIHEGAILVRVAASHIRVGTFEYFAARRDQEALETLVDYTLKRHYPDLYSESESMTDKALNLLKGVVQKQSSLVSAWMHNAFIHGVMNTDNFTISGETIDYGPCGFMDIYDPATVFSSIDHYGRYAYANQGSIASWNLGCLVSCLAPVMDLDDDQLAIELSGIMDSFDKLFSRKLFEGFAHKLGIEEAKDEHKELLQRILDLLKEQEIDFTLFFRALPDLELENVFQNQDKMAELWLNDYQSIDKKLDQKNINPAYIARNFHVEAIINEVSLDNNFHNFYSFLEALRKPFTENDDLSDFAYAPQTKSEKFISFCGT